MFVKVTDSFKLKKLAHDGHHEVIIKEIEHKQAWYLIKTKQLRGSFVNTDDRTDVKRIYTHPSYDPEYDDYTWVDDTMAHEIDPADNESALIFMNKEEW